MSLISVMRLCGNPAIMCKNTQKPTKIMPNLLKNPNLKILIKESIYVKR